MSQLCQNFNYCRIGAVVINWMVGSTNLKTVWTFFLHLQCICARVLRHFVTVVVINDNDLRSPNIWKQEAQLSQRDSATLRVIEYFAKSLKLIRNDTVEYGVCKSLLVFHWNDVCMSYRLWYISHQRMAWPWTGARSRSRSLKKCYFIDHIWLSIGLPL